LPQAGNAEGLFWFWHFINLSLTYLDTYPLTYSPGTHTGQTVLIIFSPNLQLIIIVQVLSTGRDNWSRNFAGQTSFQLLNNRVETLTSNQKSRTHPFFNHQQLNYKFIGSIYADSPVQRM